jgi:hypothetical protein
MEALNQLSEGYLNFFEEGKKPKRNKKDTRKLRKSKKP